MSAIANNKNNNLSNDDDIEKYMASTVAKDMGAQVANSWNALKEAKDPGSMPNDSKLSYKDAVESMILTSYNTNKKLNIKKLEVEIVQYKNKIEDDTAISISWGDTAAACVCAILKLTEIKGDQKELMQAMKTTLSIKAKFQEFEPFIVNLANQGKFDFYFIFLVTLALLFVRTFGMASNRYIDYEIDKLNERTQSRPLASGALSKKSIIVVILSSSLLFVILCFFQFI